MVVGKATTSTSSRASSSRLPPAPMALGTSTRLLLVATRPPTGECNRTPDTRIISRAHGQVRRPRPRGARCGGRLTAQCKPIVSAHKIDTLACGVKRHDLYLAGGTRLAFWSPPVVLCQLTGPMHIGSRQPMSIALSKARNPAIFQFKLDQVRKRPSISNRQCQPDRAARPASSRRRGD
jgi:hypothetical protein